MATNKTKAELEAELEVKTTETDEMKNSMATLTQQMEQMQKIIESLKSQSNTTEKAESAKVASDEEIPVMSLCPSKLYISSEGKGQGDIIEFTHFGEVIDIAMGELKDFVSHNKSFFKGGLCYIMNDNAVKQLRLKSAYDNIITEDVLESLFDNNADKVVEIYDNASDIQKSVIVQLIVDKKYGHAKLDANILTQIGERCDRDLLNIINPQDIPLEGEK